MHLLDALLTAQKNGVPDPFGGLSLTTWCSQNNISRATAYRHKSRIDETGRWEKLSRRPELCPHRTAQWVEVEVIRLRLSLGRDCGADNIRYHLDAVAREQDWKSEGWSIPSRATINKILVRNGGLVTPEPKKRPKSSYKRFQYAKPRDCYQIDATEVKLAGGGKATIFEVLDDCTRTLVSTLVTDAETALGAVAAIKQAFEEFGVPAIVLSDNGTAFTAKYTQGGRSQFTRYVTSAGARLIHSSPYHPQTNGKVERHHRTFKQWLADQPIQASTTTELQVLCQRYQRFYNTERRHSALNMPPAHAWNTAELLGGPEQMPVQTDATVGTHTVSDSGVISVGMVNLSVGRAHSATTVTIVRNGDHLTAYAANGDPLGHLHIDHTKRYQGRLQPAAA